MKQIKVNDEILFEISDFDEALLASEIIDVRDEIERRLKWAIGHKLDQVYARFRKQWEAVLMEEGAEMIPLQRDTFISLIINRPDYINRAQQE